MSDYDDDLPIVVIEKRTGTIGPFLWGALLGAGATLLFAPRSGEETRRELSGGMRRLREQADAALRDVQDAVTDAVREVRHEVETRVDMARSAYDAGRDAARGARDDLGHRLNEGREAVRASYRGGAQNAQPESAASADEDAGQTE